jgi:hypothetical protein
MRASFGVGTDDAMETRTPFETHRSPGYASGFNRGNSGSAASGPPEERRGSVRRTFVVLAAILVLTGIFGASGSGGAGRATDPGVLTQVNEQLAAMGLSVRAESIEFLTIGQGRPSNRIHAQAFRGS